MQPDELLLRDIHLPEPVSWWPPAIGWWLVAALILTAIVVTIFWLRHRAAVRKAPATLAAAELARLQATWEQTHDMQWLLSEVSTWLRRVCMSLAGRQNTAGLTGSQWQQFLNELAGEQIFTAKDSLLITAAPYRSVLPDDSAAADNQHEGQQLLALCQHWLDAATRRKRPR